jgi:hypothetical protein
MTEAEWLASSDAPRMIDALWHLQRDDLEGLERRLHWYYLLCCRAIWKLLPQEASRRGVEVAERFLAGEADDEELSDVNWSVEGAAFCIDYNTDPESIEQWIVQTQAMPDAELRAILHPPEAARRIETRELLKRAAYFADYCMIYPRLLPKGPPPQSYAPFLSADLLREVFGSPFGAGPGDRT